MTSEIMHQDTLIKLNSSHLRTHPKMCHPQRESRKEKGDKRVLESKMLAKMSPSASMDLASILVHGKMPLSLCQSVRLVL